MEVWFLFPLRLIILTIVFIFFSGSCLGPKNPTVTADPSSPDSNAGVSEEVKRQSRVISRLLDEILRSLATNNFARLEQFFNSGELQLSGAEAAGLLLERLIGQRVPSIVLELWDARDTEIFFDDDLLLAAASIEVSYRISLNRKSQTEIFTFYFYRSNQQQAWRLDIR
jgi:hypothetical protein